MTFGFDEQYPMFGATPVENQFILELLPEAKGDYVRVYLYGLLRCYYPEEDMNLDRMGHELHLTEEEIRAAYRYWERRGVVRRISDNPPSWRYVNGMQRSLSGGIDVIDPEYEAFGNALYDVFDSGRRLHGSELAECFEWHEEMHLPTEVIIMLLKHMAAVKGKQFRIHDAGKVAMQMADEQIATVEDAEAFLSRDRQMYEGIRRVLRKLGKRYMPSEAQVDLYRKWTREWRFTPEAIEDAVKETAKGDPSLAYLDKILQNIREGSGASVVDSARVAESGQRAGELRQMLDRLGTGTVTPRNLELYDEMRALYNQEIILMAAEECRVRRREPEDVLKLLKSWKERGLETTEDVGAYVEAFRAQTELIARLKELWGEKVLKDTPPRRETIARWQKELGFGPEMILTAAEFAAEADRPMAYLNTLLLHYQQKGIRTPEEARRDHESRTAPAAAVSGRGKKPAAQEYDQRDYTEKEQRARERFLAMNGGSEDA